MNLYIDKHASHVLSLDSWQIFSIARGSHAVLSKYSDFNTCSSAIYIIMFPCSIMPIFITWDYQILTCKTISCPACFGQMPRKNPRKLHLEICSLS